MNVSTTHGSKGWTRWRAAGTHLAISAMAASAVLALMLLAWYPPPLFEAEGGSGLVLILVGVDVVLGPLVTLIVFRAGKPGMRFDLWTIGVLQSVALVYGCHVVFEVRPVFIAFVKDQFEVVSAIDLSPADLREARRPEYRRLPLLGPVTVAVEPPADEKERQALLFLALEKGRDMRHFPKYYVPFEGNRQAVLSRGRTMAEVRRREPEVAKVIDRYLADRGVDEKEVLYFPLRASRAWGAVLVDRKSGERLKTLIVPG